VARKFVLYPKVFVISQTESWPARSIKQFLVIKKKENYDQEEKQTGINGEGVVFDVDANG
jgi:hypothetical protein